jgi:hypothetical protein
MKPAVLEEATPDEFVDIGSFEYSWPAVQTEFNEGVMWANAERHTTFQSSLTHNVFGTGRSASPNVPGLLYFTARRHEHGEDGGEFALSGSGTLRAYGAPDAYGRRSVFLKGTATHTYKFEQTPFIEGFHGYATVSDDEYVWSVNSTSLLEITGIVVVRPPTRRVRQPKPHRAYYAFRDLGEWLEMSDEELSDIVKVSRGTATRSWKNGTPPRKREQARRLFQLHALVAALRSALGDELTVWLKRGSPCPTKLLEQGDFDRFARKADAVIFPPSPTPQPRLDAAWPANAASPARDRGERSGMKRPTRVRSKRLAP